MIGLLRRRRLLASVLFGSLLTGGCQQFGTNSESLTPSGTFNDKAPKASVKAQATASTTDSKKSGEPEQPSVKETSGTIKVTDYRETSDTDFEPKGKEATPIEVDYIPPTATITTSTSNTKSATPSDVSQRTPAAATGRVSKPPAGDGRFDREGEMTMRFDAGGAELKALETRMQQLEQRLEQRDKAVRQSGAEVQAATEELHRTLAHVETWRKEVDETRTKMRDRDKDEIESLKTTVKTLERLLGEED